MGEEIHAKISANRIEHFAALTLAIVLLREQVMSDSAPVNRRKVIDIELSRLVAKRAELEEQFENRIGGS